MSERIVPARYKFEVPVKVWFEPNERAGKKKYFTLLNFNAL